jgi:hypothetical protein
MSGVTSLKTHRQAGRRLRLDGDPADTPQCTESRAQRARADAELSGDITDGALKYEAAGDDVEDASRDEGYGCIARMRRLLHT